MPNPYLILGVLIAFGLGLWQAYQHGYEVAEGVAAKAQAEALTSQKAQLEAYYANRKEVEVVYRDRVRTITEAVDTAGCLDAAIPDGVLNAVRGD